jgi:NADPH-dependent 2,4-dienoyl-CoA reductase/sulfur reductase-like enzyme
VSAHARLELVTRLGERAALSHDAARADDDPCDVAVIGAGPYGLAATAHLRATPGLDVRVFGEPMSFWQRMPAGMQLRSPWTASHIPDPARALSLDRYRAAVDHALDPSEPIPLDAFVRYGRWVQGAVVPDLDRRHVQLVEADGRGFRLLLGDGAEIRAATVVVAAGIAPFAWMPEVFRRLPATRVSHTAHEADLSRFAGRRLLVVGAGQSALECAALAREAGATVELAVRAAAIRFLVRSAALHRAGPLTRLLYASSDVGPAGVSHLVAHPHLFRTVPRAIRDPLARCSIRPAGAAWLVPRLDGVVVHAGVDVRSGQVVDDEVVLRLSDGRDISTDHVLCGTGWRVDVARYGFLGRALLAAIRRVDGYPVLDLAFGTSVRGLHVVGAPAAWSFGPLMRFVAGSPPAARALARALAPRARRAW